MAYCGAPNTFAECPPCKLRNTQHEHMSSALPPRTDWLARPQTLRGSRPVKHLPRSKAVGDGKRPIKVRHRFDNNGHRVLVGLSADQTFEFEALDELLLDENGLPNCFLGDLFRSPP
jgi:hypothetical protein